MAVQAPLPHPDFKMLLTANANPGSARLPHKMLTIYGPQR